jgi:hypothetical protein
MPEEEAGEAEVGGRGRGGTRTPTVRARGASTPPGETLFGRMPTSGARYEKAPEKAPGALALTKPGWQRASRAAAVFRACQKPSFAPGEDVRGGA